MPTLKVGLAPGKTSYFDKLTNLYLTLDTPFKAVNYTNAAELEKITHAILCNPPAIKLYEGVLPAEAVAAWETKFLVAYQTTKPRVYRNLSGAMVADNPNLAFDRSGEVPTEIAGVSIQSLDLFQEEKIQDKEASIEIKVVSPDKSEEVGTPGKSEEVVEIPKDEEVVEIPKDEEVVLDAPAEEVAPAEKKETKAKKVNKQN